MKLGLKSARRILWSLLASLAIAFAILALVIS